MAKTKRLGITTCLPPGLFVSSGIFERGFYLDRGFIWYRHDFWIELKSACFSLGTIILLFPLYFLALTSEAPLYGSVFITVFWIWIVCTNIFKRVISPRVAFDLENREIIDYFSDRHPFSMNFDSIATLGIMRNNKKNRFDGAIGVFAESFSGNVFWLTVFYRNTEAVTERLDEYMNGLRIMIGTKAKIENRDFDDVSITRRILSIR